MMENALLELLKIIILAILFIVEIRKLKAQVIPWSKGDES